MCDNEKNILTMYENVITYLLENRDIISINRSFFYAISKLREAIDEIKLKDKGLSNDTLEKTILTYKAKDELIFILIPVTTSLFSIAKEYGNVELKDKTRLSHSQLVRLRDNDLINKSMAIQHYAICNILRLRKYGITKITVLELIKKIEIFRDALNKKILSLVSGNLALSLNSSFQNAEKILINQLDKLMEQFSDKYEEFYDDYLSMRSMEYIEELEEELLETEVGE